MDLPYDEITVTRRYYRSGESEYFINRKAVRLRDVHELFMNTGIGRDGYSVIGQAKSPKSFREKVRRGGMSLKKRLGSPNTDIKNMRQKKSCRQTDENLGSPE